MASKTLANEFDFIYSIECSSNLTSCYWPFSCGGFCQQWMWILIVQWNKIYLHAAVKFRTRLFSVVIRILHVVNDLEKIKENTFPFEMLYDTMTFDDALMLLLLLFTHGSQYIWSRIWYENVFECVWLEAFALLNIC